ncbi:uncharacterized protein LOC106670628 isoform X1 [Cimex lectularius]|uniref:Uncharacterized protein n=1 Tax=Cimex lectularius TaxID=79782 RepID=A0A8I6S4D7_CIMLE|nr:uncharacterized protein LOC106670628 isoform X1 [Cimex lectularius]
MYVFSIFLAVIVASDIVNGSPEILERIVNEFDNNTLERELDEISNTIDAVLKEENSEFSPLQEGYTIEPIYFHANECTVSAFGMKMYEEDVRIVPKTSLTERIISLKVWPKTLLIEGKFKLNRINLRDLYSKASGSFRIIITGLKCEGTAAIVTGSSPSIEWLQLFCDHKGKTTNTQTFPDFVRGPFVERYMDFYFGTDVNKQLERNIDDRLEDSAKLWLTKRLGRMSMIIRQNAKIRSQAYKNSSDQEEVDANEIFDGILGFAVFAIKNHFNDTIKIPDIREGFEKNIFSLVRVGAQFTATDGTAREVSTLSRYGNARIMKRNLTIYFMGGIKFEKLHINYLRYKAELIGIGPSGAIETRVAPIAVRLVIHIDFGNTRKVYLDRFRICHAGKIKVKVTGMGRIIDSIISTITTWVVAMFKNRVLSLVERRIIKHSREALGNVTIDDIITGQLPF